MKPLTKILFPMVGMVVLVGSALADELSDFKSWYMKSLPEATKAYETKNIGYFEKVSTTDFTYTEFKGPSTPKKPAIAGLKQMLDSSEKIKFSAKLQKFSQSGKMMVVEGVNHFDMVTKPGPDKKTHKMTMMIKVKETWAKVGGKWLLKNIKDMAPAVSTMDGKPMKMPG